MGILLLFVGIIILIISCIEFGTACKISRARVEYIQKHNLEYRLPSLFYRCLKRLADIILSALVCLSILPVLYLVLGVVIKLTSEGPIIFKQKRIGLFGKPFVLYKFRSMYKDADSAKVTEKNDERITRIGRYIRRTHIDEFPQFFNILRGDMSLVGPRPLPEFRLINNENSASYYRLLLRPGLTGITQVNSGRLLSEEKILQYDKLYVSNPSLIKDLCLCLKTLQFKDISY